MIVAGVYSFKDGLNYVQQHFPHLLEEATGVIASIDASVHKTKRSKEKTMPGRVLYSPTSLNRAFEQRFSQLGWQKQRVRCDYPTTYYTTDYQNRDLKAGAFREMDFCKEQLGIEVQFGKYAFMVYNVCAKMTIFNKLGYIEAGIEIVPIKQFADEMSTGVSYFEQFIWDLEHRGTADIDIPVIVFGIDVSPLVPV